MTINIGNTGLVINDNVMEKMEELRQVNRKHAEASTLWVACCEAQSTEVVSELLNKAEQVTIEATEMTEAYYAKYPNCLSRNLL